MDSEIGKFPEDWKILTLEEATEKIIDYRGKTPKKTTSGIPLITAKIVKNGHILEPEEFISENDYEEWMRRGRPQSGDVIITTEAPMGEVAQLDNRKVALAQRLITLRGKKNILNNNFLRFVLQSSILQNELRKRESGTTVTGIKQSELRKVLLPIPPYLEQKSISDVLLSLDDKITLNRQMNSALEAIGQTLFRRWFVDFEFPDSEGKPYRSSGGEMMETELGEVPRGWRVVSFDEIVEIRGGSTPKTENPTYWNGNIPWITPKDLTTSERIHFSRTSRYITQAGLESISKNLLPVGTILLSSRAPIGYVAINDVPMATNQGFINIICSEKINNLFLYYWLKFNKELLLSFANGTTFQELSKSSFKKIKLILPHQTQMNLFKAIISPLDLQIANNHNEIEKISQIRDALLPKLMSGEVRVITNNNLNNENK